MDEQSEYQKLKHSYQGNYQRIRRRSVWEKRDWSGCGTIMLVIALSTFMTWLLWLVYEYIFPPMGAPHIPFLLFWGIMILLRTMFGNWRK